METYEKDPDNIYFCDSDGWTTLHYAACTLNFQQVKKLLDLGANVNAETKSRNTPLHYALHQHFNIDPNPAFFETVKILIQYGANLIIRNHFNKTALDNIRNKDARKKMEDFILQYGNAYKVAIDE